MIFEWICSKNNIRYKNVLKTYSISNCLHHLLNFNFYEKDSVNFWGIYIGNMASITLKQPYWRMSSLGLLYPCQRELGLKKIHYGDKDISKKEGTRNQNEILWSMPLH